MSTTDSAGRDCPNCHAFVPAGHEVCSACKLQVAQMDAFAAAKRAAQRKGIRHVEVQERSRPIILDPKLIALAVVVLVIGGLAYMLLRPAPPRYLAFPGTAQAVVRELLGHIATGDNQRYDQAYALIAEEARNPRDADERGHYRGLFHAVHMYLTEEFGADWLDRTTLMPDPADSAVILARIGPETLHIRAAQQTPAERMARDGEHFAVLGIDEFDVRDAAAYQALEARMGVIRGAAGQAAADNIQTLFGPFGTGRERPMQKKIRLLSVLRNPRAVSRYAVIHTWPLREDPVIRARLEIVANSARYTPEIQRTARDVLTNAISDEELIAARVDY